MAAFNSPEPLVRTGMVIRSACHVDSKTLNRKSYPSTTLRAGYGTRVEHFSPSPGVIPTGAVFPAEGGISYATRVAGDPSLRLNCGSAQDDAT